MNSQPQNITSEFFSISESALQGRTLSVLGSWNNSIETALSKFDVDSLTLNYAQGYNERNLEFLPSGLKVRKLSILSRTTEDLSPLYRLAASLEYLYVEVSTKATLDLARLPLIRHISADWSLVRDSLLSVESLESAAISRYAEEDLRPIGEHANLLSLELGQLPQIQSLSGIEGFPNLRSLSVMGARRLTDISQLSSLNVDQLTRLQVESCKSIESLEAIHACQRLEFLNISELGPIPSMTPLGSLRYLEKLYAYGSTKVMDGDLAPIAFLPKLRELRMANRRSYRPLVEQIQQSFSSKTVSI